MRVKIGIIGLGDIAEKAYLPVVGRHEGVDIVGIASPNAATVKRIGEKYRITGMCSDIQELLALRPDAVFVHSPTETHADIVERCLKSGAHVYVDKPLSYSIAEAERMEETAQRANRLLCVGFNRRFAPMYVEAKAWIEGAGGGSGRPDICFAHKHRTRLQGQRAALTLYDDLIHMLDLLVWLGGDRIDVKSYMQRTDGQDRLLIASGALLFRSDMDDLSARRSPTPNIPAAGYGMAGYFSMARQSGADLEKLELHGGGRSAEVTNMERAVFSSQGGAAQEKLFGSWDDIQYRRGFAGVIEHFLRSLNDPGQCQISAERVLPTHRLIESLLAWHNKENKE